MNAPASPIVVFVPDLMMRRRLVEGLLALGYAATGAATRGRLDAALAAGGAGALLVEIDGVDVDGPAIVREMKGAPATAGVPLLGFCAHTRTELIDAVRAAGADRVVSRGELTRRLGPVVAELVGPPAASPATD